MTSAISVHGSGVGNATAKDSSVLSRVTTTDRGVTMHYMQRVKCETTDRITEEQKAIIVPFDVVKEMVDKISNIQNVFGPGQDVSIVFKQVNDKGFTRSIDVVTPAAMAPTIKSAACTNA